MQEKGSIRPELWGGLECTVNRVGDEYFNQMRFSGHHERSEDLDLFAKLGFKKLRYPMLWEYVEAEEGKLDWSWTDERYSRLQELGLDPISGLVHHGSGPSWTSLVDPTFPERFAQYAGKVAERYPWIDYYNPVNEPLTTARFSGLYGFWYPHGNSVGEFARCLLNECKGVILAMRAIREVNPEARLIQTDDVGKTHTTPLLSYQGSFENERRWLAFDLLCGKVTPRHKIYRHLLKGGITPDELAWFEENSCPPDVIGVNYYVTSERYLDEDLSKYPRNVHGGNGKHRYADVEAVRVERGMDGPDAILREVWDRYGIPIAVTEAHLSCTREEQMRWLLEIWNAGCNLKAQGVDFRAVTVWSLLGAYDWNSLLTRTDGYYEPGVFDLRSNKPRPTALANLSESLAKGTGAEQTLPFLSVPGWWNRNERVVYGKKEDETSMQHVTTERPLLITGATGTLGRAFARICEIRGIPYRLLSRSDLDITEPENVQQILGDYNPWAIVNTAGYVRVDDAEKDPEPCHRENTHGPTVLADACAVRGVRLLTYSSDLVFDGTNEKPYLESHPVSPLSIYGMSKANAEERVLETHPQALVVRTSAFFGPWDGYNFVTLALSALARRQPFCACSDATVSPTYVPDLVNGSLDLLIDGESGIWHLANEGEVTWADFARSAADLVGLDATRVEARPTEHMGYIAARPRYSVLRSERGMVLSSLEDALSRYVKECDAVRDLVPAKRSAYIS